ncbi:succinate dehydrogenase, cytochrome b556 subunit [Candidatus Deianiraea vastatrix]|uniref:Succinate dehydrogenase cytochrome b556 subunit n=1 Tax=Candidatus Deianiraea vastatrix TaxID=2163644 RepID=A0A5B8XIA4_9RICK|nr:succinate dehydrogenase, cytochrome b556 subunit [Candidatus Deianiraea vastatrix]QED23457.1 Succinate dehydrogenase/Fumarate reductase transmembrane subunit [Candidatus Deianiraea vastatrix]
MHNRPTSPHLSIYKWQITSVFSILHRLSGIGLFVVFLLFAILFSIGVEKTTKNHDGVLEILQNFQNLTQSCVYFKYFIFSLIFITLLGFFYHALNGIRFLFWSFAMGFNLKTVEKTAYLVLILAFLLSGYCSFKIIALL